MIVVPSHGDGSRHLGTIIAGYDYQRVVGHTEAVKRLQQLSHDVVKLEYKIAMRTGVGFASKILAWKGGQVNRLSGVEQEEGFTWVPGCVILQESLALIQKHHVDFLQIEVIRFVAKPVVS